MVCFSKEITIDDYQLLVNKYSSKSKEAELYAEKLELQARLNSETQLAANLTEALYLEKEKTKELVLQLEQAQKPKRGRKPKNENIDKI